MRRTHNAYHRSGCPIGIALDLVGDPWTLLVVRDLMFKGAKTYLDFVNAGEGIATNVLSDRLARLEEHDIVDKTRDPNDGRRFIYELTEKGIDLAPVLLEFVLWASRYHKTDAPTQVLKAMRNDREAFLNNLRLQWSNSRKQKTTVKK